MKPDFAAILSQLRHDAGYSQKQAAQELGVSQALLSHYENGVREPKFEFVVRACDYYGVSADYILGRVTEKSRQFDNEDAVRCCQSVRAAFGFTDGSEELAKAIAKYISVGLDKTVKILRDPEHGSEPLDDAVMKLAEANLIRTAFDTKSRYIFSDENLKNDFPSEYKAFRETATEVAVMRAELTNNKKG